MQKYLNELESWSNKWRLNVAPKKCNFMVFNKRKRKKEYKLKVFNEEIPHTNSTRYLGIELNSNLNFQHIIKNIRIKCIKLLNILKCLSTKKWSLDKTGLLMVYKALIRSNLEYAAPILVLNDYNIKKLHGIQYQALRIILKKPIKTSNKEMHEECNIIQIENRLFNLSRNYLNRNKENPLIGSLQISSGLDFHSPLQKILIHKNKQLTV
jgi:hypothetical protein